MTKKHFSILKLTRGTKTTLVIFLDVCCLCVSEPLCLSITTLNRLCLCLDCVFR